MIMNMKHLFSEIQGSCSNNSDLPALRYGCAMEVFAIEKFHEEFSLKHRIAQVKRCGLLSCENVPFVGGSTDRIVTCDCCGVA